MAEMSSKSQALTSQESLLRRKVADLEQELSAARERLAMLSQEVREGICIHDNGVILDGNQAFAAMFGYRLEELIGQSARDLATPETWRVIQEKIASNSEEPYEGIGVHKDGSTFPCLLTGRPYRYRGRPVRVASFHDLSDLRQAELALNESEQKYRALIGNLRVGVYRTTGGMQGRFLYANQALAEMFGYATIEEFLEVAVPELYQDPADRGRFILELGRVGFVKDQELRLKKKDGAPFWCSVTATLHRDGQGRVQWIDGVIEDIDRRKAAEDGLREQASKFSAITATATAAIVLMDHLGRISYWNPAAERMFGYGQDQALGQDLHLLLAPERYHADYRKGFEQFQQRGTGPVLGNTMELMAVDATGREFPIEVSTSAIEVDGRWQAAGIIRDVSERTAAEERLRFSEERFRSLSENAPDIIYTLDYDGTFNYVNPSWERILGHPPERVLGRYFVDFARPEDAKDFVRVFKRIRDHKQTINISRALMTEAGEPRHFSMSGAPNLAPDGRVIGMVGMLKDITESIKAEEALKESEERHRAALDASPDPVVIYDREGQATYVNPAFSRVFGWQAEELLGRQVDFLPESERAETARQVGRALAGVKVQSFETRRYTKDRRVRDVSISSALYRDREGQVAGIMVTLRDITERKRREQALKKSEASLVRAQKMAHLGNWEMDLQSGELICSDEVFGILGIDRDQAEVSLEGFLLSVHRDDRQSVQEAIEKAPGIKAPIDLEHRIVRPGGEVRVVHQLGEVVRDQAGRALKIVGALQDITVRRRSEEQMRLLARIFENTIEGIMVTDRDGVIQMVNQAFTAITGFGQDEAVGATPSLLSSGRHPPQFYAAMWKEIKASGSWQGELWNRRKSGEAFPVWLTITAIADSQGRVSHYVGVFHDITEIKRSEERITHQAYHDALTGLPNRMLFNDRLGVALAHAARNRQGLAIVFLDLDNFKNINDSLGHAAGDLLLQSVAKRLVRWVREEDTVARIGGDEFIMLLQGTDDPDYVVHVASRILESLSEPFRIKEREFYITASIGITLFPHDGRDIETLVSNADIAMYRAKEEGRNKYKLFTPAMNAKLVQRLALETSLRKALTRGEFWVHYQPKVDLVSGRVMGLEALVRWNRPGVGLVRPDDFIPLAEETGLIVPIGEWVLRTACRRTKQWHDAGHSNLQVAVNLSPRQFQQRNLVHMVGSILEETGLPPKALELEVTENVVMFSVEQAIITLRELSRLGVQLSMDDFGRGYSSLYYLKRFPMNALKIDRSFVSDIDVDPDSASIVHTIINMSRSLNLKVVAEGVETAEQLAFLREHQCDQLQGYLFSRPISDEEVTELLQRGALLPGTVRPQPQD